MTLKYKLYSKLINYLDRNHKLSPLNKVEYLFLKKLYWYLTKQVQTQESKEELYYLYQKLFNVCFFPNRETININMVNIIYTQCQILLEREYKSPWSFIILNKQSHYQKLQNILLLLKNWTINEKRGPYMDEKEFWENMEFLRKEFNSDRIDIHYEVGKWPKKLRKRFNRFLENKDET